MQEKTLALFDFDGTITHRDSLLDFIVFVCGWARVFWGGVVLLPVLCAYGLKQMSNDDAKQKVIEYFFGGMDINLLRVRGVTYAQERLPKILRTEGLAKLRWHQRSGHRVVLVTASSDIWLQEWAEIEHVELISTRYETHDNVLTGRYQGLNCHGKEKVRRIREAIDLSRYEEVYAYGDTSGDRPMLALATYAFYKSF